MITNIETSRLYSHPNNPRKDLGDLSELAASIKANGILQNLTVVPWVSKYSGVSSDNQDTDPMYTVVIGHRRLAAAKLAGLSEVPCSIAEMDEKKQIATMLLENIQRSDLTFWEQAHGFQLMLDLGDTVGGISKKTGFSKSMVQRRVKLLDLDSEKLKDSAERGATLQDYEQLEKIKDINLKNRVLDTIGTNNFQYDLRNAIDQEAWEKYKADVITVLDTFAYKADITDDLQSVKYISRYGSRDFQKPDDAGNVKYYYNVDYNSITLYKERSKNEPVIDTETRNTNDEKTRKQRERTERLDEISERAYRLRLDFLKNYAAPMKHTKLVMEFVTRIIFEYSGVDLKTLSALLEKEHDGNADEMDFDDISELFVLSPERILLLTAYCLIRDNEYARYYEYGGKYRYNKNLSVLYAFLEKFGYTTSDEERALRDGTHNLLNAQGCAD